jgi:hypothetical protein
MSEFCFAKQQGIEFLFKLIYYNSKVWEMSSIHEVTMHINSAARTNLGDNPANFMVNYNNGGNVQDAIYVRPRSIMIPNMFYNVYGPTTILYLLPGPRLIIPAGLYDLPQLCAAVTNEAKAQNLLDPLFPPIVLTPTLVSAGVYKVVLSTTSPTQAVSLLGIQNIRDTYPEVFRSMNEILGLGIYGTAPVIGVLTTTLEYTPALFSPQRVYLTSDRLAFGKSIDAGSLTQSMFASVSLAGLPFGGYASHETPDSSLFTFWFREPRELQAIDIKIYDAYGDVLELPINAHVDVVVVVGLKI